MTDIAATKAERDALDKLIEGAVASLKKEFGHFIGANEASWEAAARGIVIDKMRLRPRTLTVLVETQYQEMIVFVREEEHSDDEVADSGGQQKEG